MMPAAATNVVCRFSDEVEQSITVAPDQTVLEAALSADLPLLHQCRSGACGSCVATVVTGDVRMRTGTATSLLASEQAEFVTGQTLVVDGGYSIG